MEEIGLKSGYLSAMNLSVLHEHDSLIGFRGVGIHHARDGSLEGLDVGQIQCNQASELFGQEPPNWLFSSS